MDVYIGTIMTFGFNFAPTDWQLCTGQVVSVPQNSALFALLGTIFGGNGQTSFNLPDLQGRLPIGMGTGNGLSTRVIGTNGGVESLALTIGNLPSHTHVATFNSSGGSEVTINALGTPPTTSSPYATAPSATNNVLAASPPEGQPSAQIWAPSSTTPNIPIAGVSGGGGGGTVTNALTGNSLPAASMNPYLVVNFCIAMMGIFPTRN